MEGIQLTLKSEHKFLFFFLILIFFTNFFLMLLRLNFKNGLTKKMHYAEMTEQNPKPTDCHELGQSKDMTKGRFISFQF